MKRPAAFLTTLRSEDLPGGGRWRLLEPLVYYSALLDRTIVIDAGFVADSYSVPALFAWLVHQMDRRPAFLHDEAYSGSIPVYFAPGQPIERIAISRRDADELILEACQSVGISWWRRRLIFRGVRIGGWAFFKGRGQPELEEEPLDHSPGA